MASESSSDESVSNVTVGSKRKIELSSSKKRVKSNCDVRSISPHSEMVMAMTSVLKEMAEDKRSKRLEGSKK